MSLVIISHLTQLPPIGRKINIMIIYIFYLKKYWTVRWQMDVMSPLREAKFATKIEAQDYILHITTNNLNFNRWCEPIANDL